MVAGRARAKGGWTREIRPEARVHEIDRVASQISEKLDDQEKGIANLIMAGSNLGKADIAKLSEDVDETCDCCGQQAATDEHLKWQCCYFDDIRKKADEELSQIPVKYMPKCVRSGIAPAMKMAGNQTFWGTDLEDDIPEDI